MGIRGRYGDADAPAGDDSTPDGNGGTLLTSSLLRDIRAGVRSLGPRAMYLRSCPDAVRLKELKPAEPLLVSVLTKVRPACAPPGAPQFARRVEDFRRGKFFSISDADNIVVGARPGCIRSTRSAIASDPRAPSDTSAYSLGIQPNRQAGGLQPTTPQPDRDGY